MTKGLVRVSVILPFYNEEDTIEKILRSVLKQKIVNEVLLIDDGSKDHSLNIVRKVKSANKLNLKKIKIFKHSKNKGKGAAMRTGLSKAIGELIIFQDADLEYDPSDYKKLLKPLQESRADFVIGNRWKNHTGYFLAQVGNILLTLLIDILFSVRYMDSYCGYKVARLSLLKDLQLSSNGFEIEAEIATKVALKKYKINEVNIKYKPRKYHEGKKINVRDVFRGISKILEIRFNFIYN